MPTLYRLEADAAAIAARFDVPAGADPWPGGTVAPGRFAPVITTGREFIAGPRPAGLPARLIPRLWGVPPPPSAIDQARTVLTVRNAESPFWVGNLRNSEFRCLVPATGVMEWGPVSPETGKRRRLWLGAADQPLFALAGVWKDSEVPSFALLTCEPGAALREHGIERMVAILPSDPAAWRTWLVADWPRAETVLQPYPSRMLTVTG